MLNRYFSGVGVGLISVIAPLYQSEMAPKWIRGSLVCAYQLSITIGLLIASIINIFSPPSLEVYLEVAGVLDRVFPAIDLDRAWEERLPWGKGWEEVLSFLKAMRVGRVNGGAYADLLREVTLGECGRALSAVAS